MKRFIAILLISVMLLTFCGCGSKIEYIGEVNVYNWGEYIDESIFDEFEEQTKIKVNYSTYTSNEAMYSILKTGGSSYDVIIPSDYMISRLINEGMLEKLDFSNIPNFSLIGDEFKNLECDPQNEYSVPYMWGTVGLIYNTEMVSEKITSWEALFNSQYADQILMFDNPRDAFGIALKYLGYSQNTTNEAEIMEAFELLKSQQDIVQGYVMDQIFDKLEGSEAAIGPYYAGDYLLMRENNDALAFCAPIEGSNLFYDAMCIPKGAENKTNAELFINFMCQTEICMRNIEAVGYASANMNATDLYAAELSDEDLLVFHPDESVLSNCEVFINLPQETLDLYDSLWVQLKS